MNSAPPLRERLDPATLGFITPEKYKRDGYPHSEWTWLRNHNPLHWTENGFCDPFWETRKPPSPLRVPRPDALGVASRRLRHAPA
jgi:hypothetical protein